ncbi:hypothetical protein AB0L88_11920 [Saccharopolyspora shandongensis]|uniref:discoidin domain-containing protein n=1 Tax=Saccharopolyspora shandongensis TaxID=418495 RepID=UPI0034133B7F
MRSCSTCGAQVARGEDFCPTCGAYLGWDKGSEPEPPAPDPSAPTARIPVPQTPVPAAPEPPAEPVAEPEPAQPAAVQPAKPVAPRPETNTPVEAPAVEGPPCGACGAPNPPERRFCIRCAAPLVPDSEAPQSNRARRRRRRIDRGKVWRRLVVLAVLIVLVIGGVLLYPTGREIVEDVLDKTFGAAPIGPVSSSGSGEMPDHPRGKAVDGLRDVYWGTERPGEWAEFNFDHPFRLVGVLVSTGPSRRDEEFRSQARPSRLEITATSSDGRTRTETVEVPDSPTTHEVRIKTSDVIKVRVRIETVTGLTEGKHIALGELEFFGRK